MQRDARRTLFGGVTAVGALALLLTALALTPVSTRAADEAVTIQGFAFSPATVTINVGDTVTWTNNEGGGVPHTATSDTGAFDSGTLATGQSFSFTFTQPGTYAYHCTIHPTMTGTVVVLAETTPTETATATASPTTATPTGTATTPTATATTPTQTTTATATPTRPTDNACVLQVADQTLAATSREVNIPRVQQTRAGYAVIHESNAGGNPGAVIGFSGLLAAGSNNVNLKITLDRAPRDGEKLWAMLHTEDNGNTTYDGATIDLPTISTVCGNSALGNISTFPFTVRVAVAPPDTGTGSGSGNSDAWFVAAAAVVSALVLTAAGFAVRRRAL